MFPFDRKDDSDNFMFGQAPVDEQYSFYDNDTPRLDIPSTGSPTLEERFLHGIDDGCNVSIQPEGYDVIDLDNIDVTPESFSGATPPVEDNDPSEQDISAPMDESTPETQTTDEEQHPNRSRGRPRNDRYIDTQTLINKLAVKVELEVRKINTDRSQRGDRNRSDTIRTKLIRLAKKIPQFIMVIVSSRGDYKSSDTLKVRRAYVDAFNGLVRVLNESEIHHNFQLESLEELTSLYFPVPKVIETSENQENARQLATLRASTSLKGVKDFNQANPRMREIIDFLRSLIDENRHPVVCGIMDELLRSL